MRGATSSLLCTIGAVHISTHAPLAGRDFALPSAATSGRKFQPTRPLRGATFTIAPFSARCCHFNPRAPCGARPLCAKCKKTMLNISTHAPLAGRDFLGDLNKRAGIKFQPTRPLRGATAPWSENPSSSTDFNPRAPCGARLRSGGCGIVLIKYFNPRAPCGARLCPIRAREGRHEHFNPRAPCGARPYWLFSDKRRKEGISTHAPLAGRDVEVPFNKDNPKVFQPTRPLRGATADGPAVNAALVVFQPTRPLRGATAKVYKSLCTFLR